MISQSDFLPPDRRPEAYAGLTTIKVDWMVVEFDWSQLRS